MCVASRVTSGCKTSAGPGRGVTLFGVLLRAMKWFKSAVWLVVIRNERKCESRIDCEYAAFTLYMQCK